MMLPCVFMLVMCHPHNLCAKAEIRGANLHVEAWFDNETPADGAKVRLLSNKKVVHEAITDERGICTIPTPDLGNYTIEVNAGGGHRTEILLTIEAATDGQTAGADKEIVGQRRWWGAIVGVGLIALVTLLGRNWYRSRTS